MMMKISFLFDNEKRKTKKKEENFVMNGETFFGLKAHARKTQRQFFIFNRHNIWESQIRRERIREQLTWNLCPAFGVISC